MLQGEGGIYIFELRKNPGLKANVISMYKSRFQSEGFFRECDNLWKIKRTYS